MHDRFRRLRLARTLGGLARQSQRIHGVGRHDLSWGESLLVRTRNSEYCLTPAFDGTFFVSGGWFRRASTPVCKVSINGCTFGGHAICADLVAAPGLFLEFGNGVRTTRIQEVVRLSVGPELAN